MPVNLTTGSSVPLTGATIPATAIDAADSVLTLQFDVTNHLDGNTAALHASLDISFDGGATFSNLCSVGRDKGYTAGNKGACNLIMALPQVGNANRQVRASLLSSQTCTTSLQVITS